MIRYSHILWDFNGTLLNDVQTGLQSANVLLLRRNLKPIESIASYRQLFCFPIIEYYRKIGLDLTAESFEALAEEWMEQYRYFYRSAALFANVVEVLTTIQSLALPQIILSATEKNMLTVQLSELGIRNYFAEILGLDNIHAYSKVNLAISWQERVKPSKMLLIGDTAHDFETAAAIGADCILVANGHQAKENLQKLNCPVLNDLTELLSQLTK